jgi:hypothetical protein
MARSASLFVVPLCIGRVKAVHEHRQICQQGLQEEMEMVGQKAIGY